MYGIFGPRFVPGATVERTDNKERGTLLLDSFGDYVAVRWGDDSTSWIRSALLRPVAVDMV